MGAASIVSARRAHLSLYSALIIGCSPSPDPAEEGPTYDAEACDHFVVPTRMGLGWEALNHRISSWSLRLAGDACAAETLDVIHIGGDYSTGEAATDDVPLLYYGFHEVQTDVERVGAARVTVDATIGPEGVATGDLTFSRADISLRHYENVTAIVEGIEFITDVDQPEGYPDDYDPAHGYTMRGFGGGVTVSSVSDDEITLAWTVTFDPAPAPDRARHNSALEHAEVGAKLDVLLIGATDATVLSASHEYSQKHPPPTPLEDQEIPHADLETQTLNVRDDGVGDGFFGFSQFRFDMRFEGCSRVDQCEDGVGANGTAEPGEYLRSIIVEVSQDEVTEEGGRFLVDGYLSNASRFLANYPNAYDFSSTIVWVRAGEVETAARFDETFETGSASFPLGQP